MRIFIQDFDRTPLAQLNRFLPNFGQFWAFIFHVFRTIGLYRTPPNLWIIENAKNLINENLKQTENKENIKNVLQLLFEATNSNKVKIFKELN